MKAVMERDGISLDSTYAEATRDVPHRRPAAPEKIAAVCRFLASGEPSIITGVALAADGGWTIANVPTLAFTR